MGFLGPLQGGRQWRRIDEELDEAALIFHGEADELCLLDRAVRGFLRGGDYEIAEAAALEFGGALTTANTSGAMRASMREVRLCSLGIMRPLFPFCDCTAIRRTMSRLS